MTAAVELGREGALLRVTVRGAITETTDFGAVVAAAGTGPVEIDLAGVERVNSYGVREWINFLRALHDASAAVSLARVSVTMVRQMNMIPQVRAGADVVTVFAPYYCTGCDEERSVLVRGDARAPIDAACPACGAAMEFDDAPDGYFAFRKDDRGAA